MKYPDDFINKNLLGDNLEILPEIPEESLDLIVTDPQYGWSFMGKNWDNALPPQETYNECFRVLKSGAFMFWMSGARMDCLIENGFRIRNAGFEISFTPIFWSFASGFPKAMNISKMVDRRLGAEREVIGYGQIGRNLHRPNGYIGDMAIDELHQKPIAPEITIPSSPEAKALDGGFAGYQPKPAVEVIIVAMKPLSEKSYVDQALKDRKGVTWLEDCRIPYVSEEEYMQLQENRFANRTIRAGEVAKGYGMKPQGLIGSEQSPNGRFPANILVSDDVLNDGKEHKSGDLTGQFGTRGNVYGEYKKETPLFLKGHSVDSFSRYFSLDAWWEKQIKKLPKEIQRTFPFLIVPKASKSEKNQGCEGLEEGVMARSGEAQQAVKEGKDEYLQNHIGLNRISKVKNTHPTVKPIMLGSYLITLGSRADDIILDPFAGSGSFLISAYETNRKFIGIEVAKEYHEIAEARLKDILAQKKLFEYGLIKQ